MNRKSPFFPSPYDPPLDRYMPRERNASASSTYSYSPTARRHFDELRAGESSRPFSSYSQRNWLYETARKNSFHSPCHSQTESSSSKLDTGRSSNHFSYTQRERTRPTERKSLADSVYSKGYSPSRKYRTAEVNAADESDSYNFVPGVAENSSRSPGSVRNIATERSMYLSHPPNSRDNVPINPDAETSTSTIPTKSKKIKVPHKCELCDQIFVKKRTLNRHNKNRHNIYGPRFTVSCHLCPKKFKRDFVLFRHQMDKHGLHGGAKPEKSKVRKSTEKSEVQKPTEKFEVQKPTEKSEVQQLVEKAEDKKSAKKIISEDTSDASFWGNDPNEQLSSSKRFCELCYKIVKCCNRGGMIMHMKTAHNPNFEFQCLKCYRTFEEEEQLGLHIEGRGKCISSRKPSEQELLYGIKRNEPGKVLDPEIIKKSRKQKMCVLCGKDLSKCNEKGLQSHMKHVHNPNYKFKCDICHKTFHEECLLNQHHC